MSNAVSVGDSRSHHRRPRTAHWTRNDAGPPALAAFFFAYLTLTVVADHLRIQPLEAALIWPAAGLILAAFVMTKKKRWWRICIAAIAAELTAALIVNGKLPIPAPLFYPVVNCIQGMAGASFLIWLTPHPWQRRTSVEITGSVVVGAIIAPIIGASLTTVVVVLGGGSLAEASYGFGAWWAEDFLGIALVTPMIGGVILLTTVRETLPLAKLLPAAFGLLTVAYAMIVLLGVAEPPIVLPNEFRIELAYFLFVGLLTWFALRQVPIVVAASGLILVLIIATSVSDPESALRISIGDDRYRMQSGLFFAAMCSMSAFITSLVLFEKRHVRRLIAVRRRSGVLVAQLSSMLSSARYGSFDNAVNECLEILGRHARADRCLIGRFDMEKQVVNETHNWVRPDVPGSPPRGENIPFDRFPEGVRGILEDRSQFSRRSDHSKDDPAYDFMVATNTRSAGFVPLRRGRDIVGVLGLVWMRREVTWSNDTLMILQAMGEVICSTIDRADAEAGAKRYQRNLRSLTAYLNDLDDRVRRETAIDLHDGAAQLLAVARMKLAQLMSAGNSTAPLQQIDELVSSAIEDIREVIDKMSPTVLYELGLEAALTDYAQQASRQAGYEVTVDGSGLTTDPPAEQAILLYRAARELVTNAIKHASATAISIKLFSRDAAIVLQVTDNGIGMGSRHDRPGSDGNAGFGLFSLTERISYLDGNIDIASTSAGTTVTASLPLMEQDGRSQDIHC